MTQRMACAGRGQDGLQVSRIVGSGIEHRDLALAQQVGVGSGPGHQACIAGHDAAHARRQRDALAGSELRLITTCVQSLNFSQLRRLRDGPFSNIRRVGDVGRILT